MVKDKDAFNSQFDQTVKTPLTVNRNHVFDSRQTVITVGPNNYRFPFDTEELIFALDDVNPKSLKAQAIKFKPTLMEADSCSVCRRPKDEFKKKIAQCDFCALFGCADCVNKVFPFPQLDREDGTQNFGVVCLTCETKLHINTVTSDILHALSKAELRAEARERRIEQIAKEQSLAQNQVSLQRRSLDDQIAENKLKTDKMTFKIAQQQTKITKCEQDNSQIQRHIDLRRMERANKDDIISQLKREIELT